MTATETKIKDMTDWRDERMLDDQIGYFLRTFKPKDPRDAYDFEVALHSIMRSVYRDASKPYEKILSSAWQVAMAQPLFVKDQAK